jgi:hypothetical protein
MASYNASAKLSKLAAYGVIEKFTTGGDYRHRWRVKPSQPGCGRSSHMNSDFIYSLIVGFVGAALFLFVDKYERDSMVANLLKFLVLVVGGVAILHKLKPFGLALF